MLLQRRLLRQRWDRPLRPVLGQLLVPGWEHERIQRLSGEQYSPHWLIRHHPVLLQARVQAHVWQRDSVLPLCHRRGLSQRGSVELYSQQQRSSRGLLPFGMYLQRRILRERHH